MIRKRKMRTKNYWIQLAKIFINYRKKSDSLSYLPIRLWIELTSVCNYTCIMCPNKDLKKQEKGFMDLNLYKKIVDEVKEYAFDINLAHRGESLLHPDLIEAISYAKKNKIFTRIHTNGSLLTEELSQKILSSGLDRLSFSFDGCDKETYERIRKGGNFEKTVQNITRFLEMKKKNRQKKPITTIEVIDFSDQNKHTIQNAKEKLKKQFKYLPLDSFVSKEMHNWAGHIDQKTKGHKYSICPFPWNALIVYWDGSVLPCTQDFFGAYILGDVKTETLKNIWNNENMARLRKNLANGMIDELKACSHCDRVWREAFLGVPKEYLWKFLTKRMP
jgi:radical SAM protein with 4Fe4S-binding SPASM domain